MKEELEARNEGKLKKLFINLKTVLKAIDTTSPRTILYRSKDGAVYASDLLHWIKDLD